ncbi:hypothetical protein SDC9_121504 [bioreactor metagenome]|uniref:Uncharacterized protein n=1 Tax=bioreactor metagenome TaxID=1076179 RepID=A0A645CC40_9ZZZZ
MDKSADVNLSYNQRVDISLFGDQQPWYSGYIQVIPQSGSTEDTAVYKGYGFFNDLDKVLVNKTYETIEISAMVHDLMTTVIEPRSKIRYNTSKIYSTNYTAEKLRFEYQKAKDVVKTLSEFAIDYVYGVDAYRDLFFKPLNREINENSRFWVGYHVSKFVPEEDCGDIVNFFYAKAGELREDGTNIYPTPFQDAESIAQYGIREDVLSIPSAVSDADVERWGYSELDKRKRPKKTCKIEGFNPDLIKRNIKPEGVARITVEDGSKYYDYPIKSVKYKVNSNGIQFSMQMGDYSPRLDQYIAKLYRDAKNAEFAQQLNNKQLSGVEI